ncbi:uncharacterized protein UTRI_01863 [Ustilago trichophora]|uniref:Uncharacterized protein n=1 Tax=Ustilago trichophora TaxID=86804 RepID=A0A5C3DY96_9BASI|nr:uncharacterized protein UTRI_01863 [Ustilago trichophora]
MDSNCGTADVMQIRFSDSAIQRFSRCAEALRRQEQSAPTLTQSKEFQKSRPDTVEPDTGFSTLPSVEFQKKNRKTEREALKGSRDIFVFLSLCPVARIDWQAAARQCYSFSESRPSYQNETKVSSAAACSDEKSAVREPSAPAPAKAQASSEL